MDWKRPKTVKSKTEHITSSCGTLHIIKGYDGERLIEITASIGKSGTCANCLLDSFSKVVSMYLQSPMARYKIVKKFKKQFTDSSCGMPFKYEDKMYRGCIDWISQNIVDEIDR